MRQPGPYSDKGLSWTAPPSVDPTDPGALVVPFGPPVALADLPAWWEGEALAQEARASFHESEAAGYRNLARKARHFAAIAWAHARSACPALPRLGARCRGATLMVFHRDQCGWPSAEAWACRPGSLVCREDS